MDFTVMNYGSLVMVTPLSDAAQEWIAENVDQEGWQWFGGGLAVEHRYADDLIDGMLNDGLKGA